MKARNGKMNKRNKDERVAELRAELEELTGKMVSLRDREIYNKNQLRLQKAKRTRLRELEEAAKARHPDDCTCDKCYERATALLRAAEQKRRKRA
jgi:hypothetical protein